eukprot:jgi/Botrbrau1/6840/Bobra.152_2s0004.2
MRRMKQVLFKETSGALKTFETALRPFEKATEQCGMPTEIGGQQSGGCAVIQVERPFIDEGATQLYDRVLKGTAEDALELDMEEYRRKRASQIRPNSELCLRVKELESRDFKGKHVAVAPETGKRSNVWGGQSSLMTMVPSSAALWVQQCISQNLECTWSVELEDEHDNLKTVWVRMRCTS